jgi:predicted esterase YcpF (UPF0227 family)
MILYLHGFRSAPASRKAQMLYAHMQARGLGDAFCCPQLPISARAAIALVEARIAQCATPPTLVGSSLGGYYASWLAERHGLRAVLVNPGVLSSLSLEPYIGRQTNLYTGEAFDFTPAHIDELRAIEVKQITRPERYWLLVETGDEVLDYRHAVAKFAGARQTVLEGGDHSFTRWADYLDGILAFAGLAPA